MKAPNWKRNFPSISTSLNFPLFFWQLSFSNLYIFILFFATFQFPPRNYQGLNYFWLTPSRKSRFQGLLICQNNNIFPAAFRESFAAYAFSFSPVLILLQHKNRRSSIRYKRPVCSSLHLQSTRMLFCADIPRANLAFLASPPLFLIVIQISVKYLIVPSSRTVISHIANIPLKLFSNFFSN